MKKLFVLFVILFVLFATVSCVELNKRGFNLETKNYHKTGQIYDPDGYDFYGYDKDGYDKSGFNIEGIDREGIDKSGFNIEGIDREGFNKEGLDSEGYYKTGFNTYGYDSDGFDKDGYDKTGFDKNGLDKNGFARDGLDKNGLDKNGFDRDGLDKNGLDKNGFDRDGLDKNGLDKNGFDRDGFDKNGLDKNGFDRNGINKDTGTKYNKYGFESTGQLNYKDAVKFKFSDLVKLNKKLEEFKFYKKDFELTEEYNKRVSKLKKKKEKLINDYTKKTYYYEFNLAPTEYVSDIDISYDADIKKYVLNLDRNIEVDSYHKNIGSYVGSNAFGVTKNINEYERGDYNLFFINPPSPKYNYKNLEGLNKYTQKFSEVRVEVPIEIAKKNRVSARLYFKIFDPLTQSKSSDYNSPTINSPRKGYDYEYNVVAYGLGVGAFEGKKMLSFKKIDGFEDLVNLTSINELVNEHEKYEGKIVTIAGTIDHRIYNAYFRITDGYKIDYSKVEKADGIYYAADVIKRGSSIYSSYLDDYDDGIRDNGFIIVTGKYLGVYPETEYCNTTCTHVVKFYNEKIDLK